MKYRKKPVEIEAWEIGQLLSSAASYRPAVIQKAERDGVLVFTKDKVEIATLEGDVIGKSGEMLLMGVKGEFYPCKLNIFTMTYNVV